MTSMSTSSSSSHYGNSHLHTSTTQTNTPTAFAFDDDQEYISSRLTDLLRTTTSVLPTMLTTTTPSLVKRRGGRSTTPAPREATVKNIDVFNNEITTGGSSKSHSVDFETPLALFSQAIIQLFVTIAVILKQSPIPDCLVTLTEISHNTWIVLNKEYALQKKLLLMMENIIRIQIFLISVFLTATLRALVAFQKTRGYQDIMDEKARTQSAGVNSSAYKASVYADAFTNINTLTSSPLSVSPLPSSAVVNPPISLSPKRPVDAEDIVNLSIGGIRVSTTWGTLTSENCIFAKFGGYSSSVKGIWWKEGLYFIDRDGSHFRHILNHMRGIDTVSQIEDQQVLKELLLEAEFYQLCKLKRQLEVMLGIEPSSVIPPYQIPTPPSPPRSQSPTNRSTLRSGYEKVKSIVPNQLQQFM